MESCILRCVCQGCQVGLYVPLSNCFSSILDVISEIFFNIGKSYSSDWCFVVFLGSAVLVYRRSQGNGLGSCSFKRFR